MSETQLSHVRQRETGGGGAQSGKRKKQEENCIIGMIILRECIFVVLNYVVSYNWMAYWLIKLVDQLY